MGPPGRGGEHEGVEAPALGVASTLLEPELCERFDLRGKDDPGDGSSFGMLDHGPGKLGNPPSVGLLIIVEPRDDLTGAGIDSPVAGPREPRLRFDDVVEVKPVGVGRDGSSGLSVARRVVHHQDSELRIHLSLQAGEARTEQLGAIVRADGHGDLRSSLQSLVAALGVGESGRRPEAGFGERATDVDTRSAELRSKPIAELLLELFDHRRSWDTFGRYVELQEPHRFGEASNQNLTTGPHVSIGIGSRNVRQTFGNIQLADIHVRSVWTLRRRSVGVDRIGG